MKGEIRLEKTLKLRSLSSKKDTKRSSKKSKRKTAAVSDGVETTGEAGGRHP